MLTLTIDGVDFTSTWRLYESEWSSRAYMGESIQSRFVIDDPDGTISHFDLASKKIVEVWEDASGSPVCMYRGRVANKTLGRYQSGRVGMAMRWTVTAEDYNIDFDGLRVDESTRNEESDYTRVLAYAAGYLAGSSSTNDNARDSTDLGTTYVINSDNVTMEAETYTDIYVRDVFQRICEQSAKTFFAFVDEAGDGQLYYGMHADTTYASTISITDDSVAGGADEVDVYTAYYNEQAGNHDGQHVISGGSMRYGANQFYEYSDPTSEGFHDKWEEHFQDETITTAFTADRVLKAIINSRNNEDFTYIATIDMRADQAHRIRAGMSVPLRLVAADLPTETDQRAVQVTHIPQHPDEDGEAWYRVIVELGVPRGKPYQRGPRTKPGPFPPTQPSGPTTLYDVNWDDDNAHTVDIYPSGTGLWPDNGNVVADAGGAENGLGYMNWPGGGTTYGSPPLLIPPPGQTIHVSMWGRNGGGFLDPPRYGIRFYDNATPTANQVGADHEVTDGGSHTSWTHFEADIAVPSGAAFMRFAKLNSSNSDYDNVTISVLGATGDATEPVGGNDEGAVGDDTDTYSPLDHVHAHGDLSAKTTETHHHAESVEVTPFSTIAATNVQDALEEIVAEVAGGGAPTNADYLVGTASGDLSNEIVVGTSPGGELGGTWASPTVDATHSGSTHSAATDAHIADATDAHDASAISADTTGFTNSSGDDVQEVLGDLDAAISGGGIPATIFDAAGDIIVASAADTAARLAAGDEDDVLTIVSGVPAWAAPTGGGGGGLTLQYPPLKPSPPTYDFDGASIDGAFSGQTINVAHCITQGNHPWPGSTLEIPFNNEVGGVYVAHANTDLDFSVGGIERFGLAGDPMIGIAALNSVGTGVGIVQYNDGNAYFATITTYGYNTFSHSLTNSGHNFVGNQPIWMRLQRVSGTWTGQISLDGRNWRAFSGTRADSITVDKLMFGNFLNNKYGRLTCDYFHVAV